MEMLRKIAQGCRQHYEKILLTLALLGLGAAVLYLQRESTNEQRKIDEFLSRMEKRKQSGIRQIDVSACEAALRQAQSPPVVNFSLPHNLFNPIKWQRGANNELINVRTGSELGWPKMSIVKVTPLNFTIALIKAPSPGGAFFAFTREAAEKPVERRPLQRFLTVNSSNTIAGRPFILRELKGAPQAPEALLEMADTNEKVTITTNQPYVKIEGYEADLKYDNSGETFPKLRLGSSLRLEGETYNIFAISPDEVVASAPNEKKYSVRRRAAGP